MNQRTPAVALAVYSLFLAFILLVPLGSVPSSGASSTAQVAARLGAPDWIVDPVRWEFFCNVLILTPVAALGLLVWPRTTWRDWTAFGFAISLAVEVVQGVFLPQRQASYVDVVANTLGALVGGVVVAVVRARRTAEAP
jgi:glycopeptide antibiotics resistance protein